MHVDNTRVFQLDRESPGMRYYQNAVDRHWNPAAIDLEADSKRLVAHLESSDEPAQLLDALRMNVARFGAGEQAVTQDLAPLAIALENIDDQMFVTTQLYEEAKHTDFFDRYWREVIHPTEAELGYQRSSPTDPDWFNDAYDELFERNEAAMMALLEDHSPESFANAYCHYHLTIEGILAQTGYYGMQTSFSEEKHPELPSLPGLCAGFQKIRQDEGRHVGFGMTKLKELVRSGDVDPGFLNDTVTALMPLVNGITADEDEAYSAEVGPTPDELREYASAKHVERMSQITDAAAEIPDVDTLTELDN